ncbi:zinc finger protein 227-like [Calliphora vicina]|uniref:zinc finger protein 227-like n=1 Tax=Calliphora vicina TaxID=7373 RepID=UPI00325AF22C
MKITCRICKIQQGEFFTLDSVVPIYGQRNYKLLEIYNKCCQLNALIQDTLPQVVCLACLEKLKEFFEFQLKAEKSDLELRKELEGVQTLDIKTEQLENCHVPTINQANTAIKPEVEEEVITTEDEFDDDDHYEDDEKIQEDDEDEVEDTDILFELYNKNDSCLDNYLKFNKSESETVEEFNGQEEHDYEMEINQTITEIINTPEADSNKMHLDTTASDEIDAGLETDIPIIEISRLKLPMQCPQMQTLILEPMVEIRKWQCADCGRKYLTEEKLEQHRKLHNQSEDCQCEICGTHLKSLYDYREHMKEHGTERKFSCEYCDKTFSTRANLKSHLYIHTNLRPFKCEICGKTFQQKSILKTHMTLHTGKPFECTLCHRRFSRTAHLNIHMRQHNNIRPYQCTECPSSYMQKSHLDRHISSSHLGVRFQCTICGKMYTKKPSLNTHMRDAHCTTVCLYNCEICDLDFPKQKALSISATKGRAAISPAVTLITLSCDICGHGSNILAIHILILTFAGGMLTAEGFCTKGAPLPPARDVPENSLSGTKRWSASPVPADLAGMPSAICSEISRSRSFCNLERLSGAARAKLRSRCRSRCRSARSSLRSLASALVPGTSSVGLLFDNTGSTPQTKSLVKQYLSVCNYRRYNVINLTCINTDKNSFLLNFFSTMSSATLATSCRACLRESLESYFEMNKQCHFSSDDHNFGDILNFCTHLQVKINDGFPQRICVICVQDLQQTYEFLQRVMESDKKLNELKEVDDCDNEENDDNVNDHDDFTKDPLENATDNEDNLDNDVKSEIVDDNDDEYSRTSLDNADNTFVDSHLNSTLISPHLSDSIDKDDGDFFKSVESQIFPQGRLKCNICHKAYFTNIGLQAHMDIHLPKGKTISKSSLIVGKYIKKKKIIKTAEISDDENTNNQNAKLEKDESRAKIPKPKKMFPCEVCGKQMISASKLRYHMVMHTGEKDYLCTMCPKAYSTIYALKHHMRAHTGERPYECKFCGDRFLRPTTLKSHMRRHTGERPYGCDICGKRFIQHSSMATHMKLNHMDKTIPCPYCDKKYARQTDLNTHLLSHSGDKPFACQMCPSRFTRQSNLNKHMNQHHSDIALGDKKSKKKTIKEVGGSNEITQQIESSDNNDLSMERPSCSSNLNSTAMLPLEKHSSVPSFQQMSAATNELSVNQLNNWNWPNQT